MAIPESQEVLRERLANVFSMWAGFYRDRYIPEYTTQLLNDSGDTVWALMQTQKREDFDEKLAYLLQASAKHLLDSLEQHIRQGITGVE